MRSQTSRIIVRILAVLLAVVGMGLSAHLLQKHYAAADKPVAGLSALLDRGCTTIITDANCDEVVASRWGTIPNTSTPTALVGLYYFTILFWWFLLIGDVSYARRGIHLLIAAIMALGLGFSALLVYEIKFHLPHPCTWCLVSHAANAALFVCMLLLWPRRPQVVTPRAPGEPREPGTSLFADDPDTRPAPAGEWPTGWALLVLPIVILLTLALETPGVRSPATIGAAGVGSSTTKSSTAIDSDDLNNPELYWQRRVGLKDDQIASMQKQIELLQKSLQGNTDAAGLADLQKRLNGAEYQKQYWEQQYRRYDSRWQHTYMAWMISPPVKIAQGNSPVKGPATARHSVTIYSDFQCPTCKKFEEWFSSRIIPLSETYGGIRVTFKNWPISTKCNEKATTDLHPSACDAARAAEAAFVLGGNDAFWKMHDLLFANQEIWKTSRYFDTFATQIGLNVDAFHKAMDSEAVMQKIKADILEGSTLGQELVDGGLIPKDEQSDIFVNSTPSVFVDNKRFISVQHTMTWRQILGAPTPGWQPERRTRTQPAAGGTATPNNSQSVTP